MDLLIKTLKSHEHLQAALDKAATMPLDKDDNWPYVLEQPWERFIYVKKLGAGYSIGLYQKRTAIRPLFNLYQVGAGWTPIEEYTGHITLTDSGVRMKVKLRPSFWIAPGIIALLMLIPAFFSVNAAVFGLLFMGIVYLLQKPELKKGREYFVDRVTEYLNAL